MRHALAFLLFFAMTCCAEAARAAGGPFGIDHLVNVDNSGIWARSNQKALMNVTIVSVVGGAFLLGDQDKLGDTFWRSVDSMALAAVTAEAGKLVFQRKRPSQSPDPNAFFAGTSYQSFPSGEVAAIAGAVTPFVANYGREHPAVYALELLPLYDAVARVKVRGHWQSDVLIGWGVGTAAGIWAARRDSPLILSWLPGGVQIGFIHRF